MKLKLKYWNVDQYNNRLITDYKKATVKIEATEKLYEKSSSN